MSRITRRPTYVEDPPAPKTVIASTPTFTPRTEFFNNRTGQREPCLFTSTPRTETDITSNISEVDAHYQGDYMPCTPTSDNTNVAQISENSEMKKLERAIFVRLDKVDQKLADIKSMLLGLVPPNDSSDEFLLNPCQSINELDELCMNLKDGEYKNKTIHHLSLLGSKTPGDAVRRVLRTVAPNNVWAQYSMKGRKGKGKKSLEDLEICTVIIQACRKMHPKESIKVFVECIAETFKYAPHREQGWLSSGSSCFLEGCGFIRRWGNNFTV
ncbi:uncharacterized protein LOC127625999 [Xyrauchen texanus]|uniref:uncharacterized protein LOC127625999 n=1 Tax=Xyrauchen texanus TaxID=154827 RepID=UPI002242AD19|nr:uncharacterized protein LOC127625999 [Xyrauchen texanus]